MNVRLLILTLLLAASVAQGFSQEGNPKAGQDRLVLLDGTTITGTVKSIDSAGALALSDAEGPLDVKGLRRIERATGNTDAVVPGDEEAVVELVGGGRLVVGGFQIRDEQCRVEWPYGVFTLSLDAVRAVRLRPNRNLPNFETALTVREPFDRLFVEADKKPVLIRGILESLDAEQAAFEWDGQRQTIPRTKLVGFVVASADSAKSAVEPGEVCRLELTCGSSIGGVIGSLASGPEGTAELEFRLPAGAEMTIPWSSVARILVRSDRLVYLSDLTPVAVDEEPVVAFPRPWKRDRSVAGRPLALGNRTFARGLGVQARSELTFAPGDQFEWFTATIGLDAAVGGRGDCLFRVLADDEERFQKRVKGTDPPTDVRVEIRGAKRVTLLVEPGENLDLGDQANWCDACFLRASP